MNSEDWYLDTEATFHLCSSKDVMSDFVEIIADILTKSLAKDANAKCASSMGLT